jgi:hypothetical protein
VAIGVLADGGVAAAAVVDGVLVVLVVRHRAAAEIASRL